MSVMSLVWTLGANWPNQVFMVFIIPKFVADVQKKGEVDILEGVNDQGSNAATLHTSSGRINVECCSYDI